MAGNKIPNPEHRFDRKQYGLIQKCISENNMTGWNEWRRDNPTVEIWLEGAKFIDATLVGAHLDEAHLRGATFDEANLQRAILYRADLNGARFNETDLRNASLREADLQDARFQEAQIQSAKFILARVDGKTSITRCKFDRETDFSGVGLDAANIDPDLKTALKDNIRHIHWKKWFAKGIWASRALKNIFVRPFWWMTAYGSSTGAVIYWFLAIAVIFGHTYYEMEESDRGIIDGLGVEEMPWYHTYLRAMYFSVVTMTTLGFGDMHALENGYWGHVLLTIQVILGYVLLGALVTRLGIVFTGEAPAAAPTPATEKLIEEWQKGFIFTVFVYVLLVFLIFH